MNEREWYGMTEMEDWRLENTAGGGMSFLLSERELREIMRPDTGCRLPSRDEQLRIHEMLQAV